MVDLVFLRRSFKLFCCGSGCVALLGCQGGEIHLPGSANGGASLVGDQPTSTSGEETSSGGAASQDTSQDTEDTRTSRGDGGESSTSDVPCSVSEDCFAECDADPSRCSCDTNFDCSSDIPLCDGALGSCVECLNGANCVERFGDSFSSCSAGRCVQCQTNDDCEGEVVCTDGWCGVCETDADCFGPTVCSSGHCLPNDYPN